MPISTAVSTKKRKSRSELLTEKMDQVVVDAEGQMARFTAIKNEFGYDPELFDKVKEAGAASDEDLKEATREMDEWKAQLKNDVREAVMIEKQRQKIKRKEQRKTRGEPEPVGNKSRKQRGKFI